jgi:hypothetical protein
MSRLAMLALAAIALSATFGCGPAHNGAVRYRCATLNANYSTALLFSRDASVAPAGAYAARSQWPGQTDWGRPGEAVYYRERFIDWQGPGHGTQDHTYRRFETVREGYRYR